MRVALICPYSLAVPGGVQNHVLGLGHWLGARGHEVHVLAPGRPDPEVALRHHHVRLTSTGAGWPVRFNGSVARVSLGPLTVRRVRAWLDDVGPDVLHVHEPITPSAALVGLVHATVPVVATYHTANDHPGVMRRARAVLADELRRVAVHIVVSASAGAVVDDGLGLPTRIIPNGFFPGDFDATPTLTAAAAPSAPRAPNAPAAARWRGGDGPVLGFLGRVNEPRKGLQVLVDAWPAVQAAWPDARVVVAGAGARVLPPSWQVLGRISDARRATFLAGCDVFVAPHLRGESFGLVLIEALASGARVVASDIPAFADVLSGHAASPPALFAAGDPVALADAVGEALAAVQIPGSGSAFADAGRALAQQYSWDEVGPRVLDAYAEATGRVDVQSRSLSIA